MSQAASAGRAVFLCRPGDATVRLGTYAASTPEASLNAAAKACKTTLRRLALPGYTLKTGDTELPLERLRKS